MALLSYFVAYIKPLIGIIASLTTLESVNPEFRLKVMLQRLANMGHLDSEIQLDLKIYGKDDKKARAKYNVIFKPAYTFRNLNFRNNQISSGTQR